MTWLDGWDHDELVRRGGMAPLAVTLHRTYGASYGGDYGTIRNNGNSYSGAGGCQFLIGQNPGERVQFGDTTTVLYHCNGSNFKSFGVEITGTNPDELTDWQVASLAEVLAVARDVHGIPLDYCDPYLTPHASVWVNGGGFRGVISHTSVATDNGTGQHTDLVTPEDFNRAVARIGGVPAPEPPHPEPTKGAGDMWVGHHWPDDESPSADDDWYAISGGVIVHTFGGDRSFLGIPAEAIDALNRGAAYTPLSDGDLAALVARTNHTAGP